LLLNQLITWGDASYSVYLVRRWGKVTEIFWKKLGRARLQFAPWQRRSIEGLILTGLVLMPAGIGELPWLVGLIFLLNWPRGWKNGVNSGWELLTVGLLLGLGTLLAGAWRQSSGTLGAYEGSLLLTWLVARGFTPEFSRKVLRWLTFTSWVWMLIGFWQQLNDVATPPAWLSSGQAAVIQVRSFSVFGNPNIYALYLLTIMSLAVFLEKAAQHRITRIFYRLSLIMALVSLYFTYSRVSWLLAAVFLTLRLGKRGFLKNWLFFFAGLLTLVTLSGFRARLSALIVGCDSSAAYRIRIWNGVAKILAKNWLWGIGPGNFGQVYPWLQIDSTFSLHAHSVYLQHWAEFGLGNLLGVMALLGRIFRRAWRDKGDPYRQAALIGILCFAGGGFFESWQVSRFCREYWGLLVGILLSLR
jgi:O-antigen ligase